MNVPGQRLAAAASAVAQFEKLLDFFGGPLEQRRWKEDILPRILVYSSLDSDCSNGTNFQNHDVNGNSSSSSDGKDGAGGSSSRGTQPQANEVQENSSSSGNRAFGGSSTGFGGEGGGLSTGGSGSGSGAAGGGGDEAHPGEVCSFSIPAPVASLKLPRHQGDVFGLGIVLEAVTLTANSSALRFLGEQSVALEALVHRPVWLTGL